jgi:hypothetical protein
MAPEVLALTRRSSQVRQEGGRGMLYAASRSLCMKGLRPLAVLFGRLHPPGTPKMKKDALDKPDDLQPGRLMGS